MLEPHSRFILAALDLAGACVRIFADFSSGTISMVLLTPVRGGLIRKYTDTHRFPSAAAFEDDPGCLGGLPVATDGSGFVLCSILGFGCCILFMSLEESSLRSFLSFAALVPTC